MSAHKIVASIPSEGKYVRFNYANKDFDMHLDGQYIGSRATSLEAERDLDEAYRNRLREEATAFHGSYDESEDMEWGKVAA